MKKLPDLPATSDEYWEDAEVYHNRPVSIKICDTHTLESFMQHTSYVDNRDGSVSCKFCPYGGLLGPSLRVLNGRLVDVRLLN